MHYIGGFLDSFVFISPTCIPCIFSSLALNIINLAFEYYFHYLPLVYQIVLFAVLIPFIILHLYHYNQEVYHIFFDLHLNHLKVIILLTTIYYIP